MQKNEKKQTATLDLGELWNYLLSNLWIILIATAVLGIAGFVYVKVATVPQYESTTQIYVRNEQVEGKYTYTDAMMSQALTKDYETIVTSRSVLETVIYKLGLKTTYEGLLNKIETSIPEDTRIINITVTDPDAAKAQEIANALRLTASERIIEVMGVEDVKTVDEANLSTRAISSSAPRTAIITALIGLILSAAVFTVLFMMDDTIKNEEDVEKHLGVPTLASIPMISKRKAETKEEE